MMTDGCHIDSTHTYTTNTCTTHTTSHAIAHTIAQLTHCVAEDGASATYTVIRKGLLLFLLVLLVVLLFLLVQ